MLIPIIHKITQSSKGFFSSVSQQLISANLEGEKVWRRNTRSE